MFADNHSADKIPDTETVSAFRVSQIYVGVAITLPAFLLAAQIFSALGFVDGLITLGLAAIVLTLISACTMTVGARQRLSTYAIIRNVFGAIPATAINVLLGLTLLGWFAVTVSLFADALSRSLSAVAGTTAPIPVLKAVGGLTMIGLTLYGFKLIDAVSRIAVPLMALVLVVAFFVILQGSDLDSLMSNEGTRDGISSIGIGVSISIGAFMVALTIAPDIARFLRSPGEGVQASLLSYGIGAPLVLILAGLPVLVTGEADFVANLAASGLGWPALFIVVFATITTNVSNLYSTSLSFSQLSNRVPDYIVTAVCGVLGTAIALVGIETVFVPFLLLLSIAIPPIAGVYLADAFKGDPENQQSQSIRWRAVLSFGAGCAVAYAASNGMISLSRVAAIDGLVTAFLLYLLLCAFDRRQRL